MAATASRPRFPRLPLFSALALIAFAFAATIFGQKTEIGTVRTVAVQPMAVRDLRFIDLDGGRIRVADAISGEEIAVLEPGGDGFIRGAMRGLALDRKLRGVNADASFRLILWQDGRLTLSDTDTGAIVDLYAFGRDNAAAFARFLDEASGLKKN